MSTTAAPAPTPAEPAAAEPASLAAVPTASEPVVPSSFIDSIDAFFAEPAEPEPAPADPAKNEPTPADPAKNEPTPADPLAELEEEVNLKNWTPEAARRFKELKGELKTVKARAAELESKATQFESRAKELEAVASDTRVQELEAQIAEYESKMLVSKLEESQAFKSLVRQPLAKIVASTDAIAEKYQINGDDLLDAITLRDEAKQDERLGELLANASDRDKYQVYELIKAIHPVLEQRAKLYEKSAEALAEAEALEKAREQAALVERAETRKAAANAVADKLKAKLPFLSALEGVDFDTIKTIAAETEVADPVEGAYQAMAGKLFPKLAAGYLKLQAEIDSLTEQLAEYDNVTPRPGKGLSPAHKPGATGGKELSFEDAVAAALGGW